MLNSRVLFACFLGIGVYFSSLSNANADSAPNAGKLMAINCLQCHIVPESKAPQMGDADAWKKVMKKGEDKVLENVIIGIGNMPPLGYCSSCTEADFRAMIKMMSGIQ